MAIAAQHVSLPFAARPSPARYPLLDFLPRDLPPFPGRGIPTFRVVVESSAVLALGLVAAGLGTARIAPRVPETLLVGELKARLRAAEDALGRRLDGRSGASDATRLAQAGLTRLLVLLKSAEVAHPSLKTRH